jgi:hypothetical protein
MFRGRRPGRDTGLPRSADTMASAAAGAPAGGAAVSSRGLAAPVQLIDPDTVYDDLITPSLFALWLSQLVTFAVYGLYITIQTSSI